MSSTKVTFVTGTAEMKRRDGNQPYQHNPYMHSEQRLTSQPHTPQQVSFVDGKCTCCPYGYHIDLDFLNFCRDMESGATLRNLKRIQKAKRKLRKSMEIMLDEQDGTGTPDSGSLPPDVVHSTEAGRLMHMINYERSATNRILNQIDTSVNSTLGCLDGGRGRRYLSSDSDDMGPPMAHSRPPAYHDESHATPQSFTTGRTDSLTSLSSVSTVSSESPMLTQAQLYHQQHHQKITTHTTKTMLIENPVIEMGTAEMKPMDVFDDGSESPLTTPPAQTPPPRASPDINQMSLHSVREAMAVSLKRLRELEEQVKAIPILQVRISVLKEEKRLLNLQLKASKAQSKMEVPTASVGVGNHSVIEPYLLQPDLPTGYTIREHTSTTEFFSTSVERNRITALSTPSLNMSFRNQVLSEDLRPASTTPFSTENASPKFTINQIQRTTPKPLTRSIGIGDCNVFEGSGLQIHEKEMRTVIIGQGSGVAKRNVGIECRVPTRDVGVSFMCDEEKPQTRTIGVNVNYDTSGLMTSFDFKGETELRMALKGVLQRNVHTKATNCNFKTPTEEKSVSTESNTVSVSCGDETHRTDVEIRPLTTKKTVATMAKPETTIKYVNTEKGWMMDAGTNTVVVDKYNKANMTERVRQGFAATNTEPVMTRPVSNQTDQKIFISTNQVKNTSCNTQRVTTVSTGTLPDALLTRTIGSNTMEKIKFEEPEKHVEINPYTIISPVRRTPPTEDKIIANSASSVSATPKPQTSEDETTRSSITTEVITTSMTTGGRLKGADDSQQSSSETTRTNTVDSSVGADRTDRGSSISSETSLVRRSDRQSSLQTDAKSKKDKNRNSSGAEDSFSETITEHYVITKEGKKLISQEKDLTVTTGGKTSNTKSTLYSPGLKRKSYTSSEVSRSIEPSVHVTDTASTLSSGLGGSSVLESGSSSYGSRYSDGAGRSNYSGSQISSGGSGSYSESQCGSGSVTQRYGEGKYVGGGSGDSSASNSSFSQSYSSSDVGGESVGGSSGGSVSSFSQRYSGGDVSGGSGHISGGMSSGGSSSYSSSGSFGMSRSGFQPSHQSESLSSSNLSSVSVVTNPYKTVENLAAASSSAADDSVISQDQGQSSFKQVSKTSSESNLSQSVAASSKVSMSPRKSLDVIYDIRRVGSVEDFMPDDIRKYMSITPSSTKDSGFGDDLQQKFSEQTTSSLSEGKGSKSGRVTKTVTTRRSTRKGNDVLDPSTVQETETTVVRTLGSDELDGQKEGLGSTVTSTSSSSFMSSGSKSESSLSPSHSSGLSSLSSSQAAEGSFYSNVLSAEDAETYSVGPYGSLDRKTGLLKSIMKHGGSEKDIAGRKGITFAESVTGGYELPAKVREACLTMANYLVDSTTIQTKELNAASSLIHDEWFQVSSHKLSNCHQVEDYLSSVNEISRRLLEYIINTADSNGNTAIHYCVSHCNFDIASLLMDSEVCDINKQNKAGYTPIMLAGLASVQNLHHKEIICRMFSLGNINARAVSTQQTALMLAASHGRTEMVKLLVEAGADYNLADEDGSTALMCACEHGHLDIVSFLLAQPNVNAEATDNEGSTALTIAMEAGHKDIGVIMYKHLNFSKSSFSSSSTAIQMKKKLTSGESSDL